MQKIHYILFLLATFAFVQCKSTKKSAQTPSAKESDIAGFKKTTVVDNSKETVVLPGDLQSIEEYVTRERKYPGGTDMKTAGQNNYYMKGKVGNLIMISNESKSRDLKSRTDYFYRDGALVYIEENSNNFIDQKMVIKKYYIVDNQVKQGLIREIDTKNLTLGNPSTDKFVDYPDATAQLSRLMQELDKTKENYENTAPFHGILSQKGDQYLFVTCLNSTIVTIDDKKGTVKQLWLEKKPVEGQTLYVVFNGIYNPANKTLIPSGYTIAEPDDVNNGCFK